MNISPYLFPKVYSDGSFPLMLRFTYKGKPKYKELFTLSSKDWDKKKREVKKSNPISTQLNVKISEEVSEAKARFLELEKKGFDMDSDYILGKKDKIKEEVTEETVFTYSYVWEEYIKVNASGLAPSSVGQYKRLFRSMNPVLEDINIVKIADYTDEIVTHLKTKKKKNCMNTIISKITFLNQLIKWANKKFKLEIEPLEFGGRKEEIKRYRFSEEELEQWMNIEGLNEKQQEARSILLFQFFLHGSRISDVLLMKKETVINQRIEFRQKKYGSNVSVVTHDELEKIIDQQLKTDGEYLFSYMEDFMSTYDGKDPERFEYELIKAERKLNWWLGTLAKKMKTNKKVTSHLARHSFAKIAENRGAPLRHIQKALGHKRFSTTERYLGELRDDEIDGSMALVYEKRPKGN